ncbi:aldo/keto reductase [Pseudomassariella vexata]|uniref:Aldo/keto reductase n=1 Tax=Pseudomassariella vexata TaxID=1141098 RepID=A0A1Y2DDS3_9PEZI|nr:aldo/keto reductase [Pseudomassariella vexata]ORY57432.1 aldo/keto reductase [Pseudomassariella vexata]
MMDDVLISNLPSELLRSALRVLVSQGAVTQQPFVQHIRHRMLEAPPATPSPDALFPEIYEASTTCKQYLALTRCVFSCKLAKECLPYLIHFLDSIRLANARWTSGSELGAVLATFDGDIVQAVQALKESRPEPTQELEELLMKLFISIKECYKYCETTETPYPFLRSERQVKDVLGILFLGQSQLSGSEGICSAKLIVEVSKETKVETFKLGQYQVPRLFNGLWQLSSPAWGSGTAEKQEAALLSLVKCGLTTADMADHYGDAELVYGDFRNKLPAQVKNKTYAATKWCVFGPINRPVTSDWVLDAVKDRCRRLGGRVELLQFHWHDYEAKQYLDVLVELVSITKSHPELVSTIGLCNFDSDHVEEACEYLLSKIGAVGIVTNQVQFSLLDSRPLQLMCAVCTKYDLKLLTYGSFCGGFLSEKWLNQPAPEVYSETSQLTPSQRKYFDMINKWGTWADFQALLDVLYSVARKHGVSLTNIATRWVLQQPAVGAVIVGTRLGVSAHGDENLRVFDLILDEDDMNSINRIAVDKDGEKTKEMFSKLGDCGNEYRAMH